MASIPQQYRDLFDKPITVGLATVLPSGQPQVTPVWCDLDGELVRVNTAEGRQKHKDMVANPLVTVLAVDPSNPFRYLEVRGTVERITEEGAVEHINKLSHEYTGHDYPPIPENETRVICYITPQRVVAQG